jgi:integrase
MAKRRGKDEGAIYRRADGLWVASLNLGTVNGKRKRKTVYGKTRREVTEKLRELQQQHQSGVNLAAERQTVEQYLTYWHQHHVAVDHAEGTITGYRNAIKLHIIPRIGHIDLTRLNPQHIHAMLTDMREHSAPNSIVYYFRVLHAALDRAVKLGLLSRNPADSVDAPRDGESPARAITAEHEGQIFKCLEEQQHRLLILFRVAIRTGLRRGELEELRWADVDLDKAELRVRKGKTKNSRRTLSLPDDLVADLRKQWEFQALERLAHSDCWQEHGLVFPSATGKQITSIGYIWETVQRQAGIPEPFYRFHDLRHTAATRLAEAEVHPRTAMEILGHSNIATTMEIYTHVSSQSQREALQKLAK